MAVAEIKFVGERVSKHEIWGMVGVVVAEESCLLFMVTPVDLDGNKRNIEYQSRKEWVLISIVCRFSFVRMGTRTL